MANSRILVRIALFLALLALILTACGGQTETVGEPEAEAEPAAQEEAAPAATEAPAEEDDDMAMEPIKIGGLAPLSAPGAVVGGEAMRDAMMIAADHLNARGGILGRPVELIVVDSEGLPERGTAVMERLINQDGVVGVGGGYHSSVCVAAKEVAHDNGIPVVFAEPWNDTVTSVMYPEIFRVAPLNSEVSAVDVKFIQWLRDEAGMTLDKLVILTENTDYGIPAAEETERLLEESGVDTVTFSVDIGTQDFAGIIERVKAEEPDMIVTLATGEASYNFTQQAADAGIGPQDVPTMCNQVSLVSDAFWENVPDGNYCFVRRVGLPSQLYNEQAKELHAEYSARTGKDDIESYAIASYDSIMLIAAAIEIAGSTDPEGMISALENIEYVGALGPITFPINRDNTPEQAGVDPKWWHQFPDPAITIVQYQTAGQPATDVTVVYPSTYQTGDAVIVGQE